MAIAPSLRRWLTLAAPAAAVVLAGCTGFGETSTEIEAPGRPEGARLATLEAGAAVLQTDSPLDPMNVYLVGFHPMKDDPEQQMEAHHFCHQVNRDFAQCVLFDGNTADANLNGIEYIISAHLYEQLPEEEKPYWHPHNGEILSGQLVAPGLPTAAEHALMKSKINSYGKTWHVWHTGQGHHLPLGEPMLAWSFNRRGEAREELIRRRDERMNTDTEARSRARQDLLPLARPQRGVDALKDRFSHPTYPIPGVEEQAPKR